MLFDLTKNIHLEKDAEKKYLLLRSGLLILAILLATYLFYLILFPQANFSFSLINPASPKNDPMEPRNQAGVLPTEGKLSAQESLLFDTALNGNFSKVSINFKTGNKTTDLSGEKVTLRKSYQAFFSKEGEPIGFKDGSLLKSQNNYYLVSDGKLRKFSNKNILISLGFSQEAFLESSSEELSLTPPGENIDSNSGYPNHSLFKINGVYYQIINENLQKFVSPQAFLSQYSESQAIVREENFLNSHPLSENQIGFSDGSLISYGESVFITSQGKAFPIDNPVTFEKAGYLWEDVIPVSGDELYLYQKGGLFNIGKPHPDGTLYKIMENGKQYILKNKQKHFLTSNQIAQSYFKKSPILVSEKGLGTAISCTLEKNSNPRVFSCQAPLNDFDQIIGKDFEFELENKTSAEIDALDVVFTKSVNWENFRLAISNIINKIRFNYAAKN